MNEVAAALMLVMIGFVIGYPFGLFINKLDKKEKSKNER